MALCPKRAPKTPFYDLMGYIHQKLDLKKLVVMVSLNIEGAFDNAWRPAIRIRLAEEKCPINIRRIIDSYLQDRTVRVRYGGEEFIKTTTKGCVQGSIGGPIVFIT